MLPAALPSLLARLTRRRIGSRRQDPADMGTAFGMEQWLDERDGAKHERVAGSPRSWWPRWMPGAARR